MPECLKSVAMRSVHYLHSIMYNESLALAMYQITGNKQIFLGSLKMVKNTVLLATGRCRSHASAAKP